LIRFIALVSLFGLFFVGNSPKKAVLARPNILFIIADDAGPDMGAYGQTWVKTPAIDYIAQNGLLFTKAYTPNAKCAPSRSCLITGRNSWQLDAAANHGIYFPTTYQTYQEVLRKNGYVTGFTGKGYAPGKALDNNGANRLLLGKEYAKLTTNPPSKFFSKNDYSANFAAFVAGNNTGSPWSFWVGFHEPHRAYEYQIGSKNGKKTSQIGKVPRYLPDVDTVRNDLLDYAIGIEYVDAHVQKILKTLEETGQLDNTLLVFTSDHGMPFPRVKGNQYENSNHVPLVVMWANGMKHKGRKISDYVSFVDIAPTFLEAAGIDWSQSGMYPSPGKSLFPIVQSSQSGQVQPARNHVLVGQERHDFGRPNDVGYPIRGIHKGGFLYLKNYEPSRWPVCNPETGYLNCDGSPTKTFILNQRRADKFNNYYWKLCFGKRPAEELYDLRTDTDCVKNLAQSPKHQAIKRALLKTMEAKLLEQGDLRMKGFGAIYEQYPFSTDTNGFYERFMKGEKIPTGWVNQQDYEKEMIED
jgi:N-sulfoglucosamine sulfohydrolase